jgi:thiamine transport system substrate-binding protein
MSTPRSISAATVIASCCMLVFSACGSDQPEAKPASQIVRLLTYDSFTLPPTVFDAFTADTGLSVELIAKGDTGQMLNTAILTKDDPIADVVWAINRTFLSRAATSQIFTTHDVDDVPVAPSDLAPIEPDLFVPVDSGEVCVNTDTSALTKANIKVPETFEDFTKPDYQSQLVVQNPATSAPGLAFLLATVEQFGETGWQGYWKKLVENKVTVVNGWDEAWNTEFSGAGTGTRSLVVSYSTSPVAVVAFGPDPLATSSTVISLPKTCFATAEYAGVLKGTGNEANGRKLLAFLLSKQVQKELAMNMFVFPTRIGVELPEPYVRLGIKRTGNADTGRLVSLTPERIQAMRDVWIDEWTTLVLG